MPIAPPPADIPALFAQAIMRLPAGPQGHIGLAVSGGGDSLAMLHLAARARPADRLWIVSIDHGLRDGAKDELALVARQAARLGIRHDILQWTWDGQGNLQNAARMGRWAAIRDWASMHNLREVWFGHTQDDQVETVLMRLARGSGIDGLTAMYPRSLRDGVHILRPLLHCSRDDLRRWLRANSIFWADDPSNDDPRFDRVRARQMFDQLAQLGLTRKRLLQTVDHMQAAHLSLQRAARDFAMSHVRQDTGDLHLDADVLKLDGADGPRRVLAAAVRWVGSRAYRPRFDQLRAAAQNVQAGRTVTLGGCVMQPTGGGAMRLFRETAKTPEVVVNNPVHRVTGVFWDKRWFLDGPVRPGLTIKALGAGIAHCPNWRDAGLPRASMMASPAVWDADTLLAAPLAHLSGGWAARIVADFHTSAFAIED